MKILIAKGAGVARGQTYDVTWEAFRTLIYDHSVARPDESEEEKKRAYWFSTVEYRDSHRRRENIIGRPWAVVVDLDAIKDKKAVEKAFDRLEYIAWTTWNSTPESPRWRIVVPIKRGGIDADLFASLVRRVVKPIGDAAKVDARSFLPEQLWFLPWYKRSNSRHHEVWTHDGEWLEPITEVIKVDFSGVRLAAKPSEVGEGERNNSLVLRLQDRDALLASSEAELLEIANEWNDALDSPMKRREVRDVVRKKWRWFQRGEGLARRSAAWKSKPGEDFPDVGSGVTANFHRTAPEPEPLVGDFLFPGATLVTAKMKEGKSFLTMQLAMSIASGSKFLNGSKFPGFEVHRKVRAVVIGGEDTPGQTKKRFLGNIAAGHLPDLVNPEDVLMVYNDDLDRIRASVPGAIPGCVVFEKMVERWYKQGYRLIAIDPLRVLEAALGIAEYPGTVSGMNLHARDFLTTRFYTRIAQEYHDLAILISMHHGKNKRGQDTTDPGDMIAGTTGYGAGAVATMALLPVPEQLESEDDDVKRRELHIHGRDAKVHRLLLEQNDRTGLWQCLGEINDEKMSAVRKSYFEALMGLGGTREWISAEAIAKAVGKTQPGTVHKVLNRARRSNVSYLGWKLVIRRGVNGGYRLIGGRDS